MIYNFFSHTVYSKRYVEFFFFYCFILSHSPSSAPADLCQQRTSAHRHLASPAAVRAADTMLRTPREEITWLTGVHQGVAIGGQVQTHNVSIGWTPWLLAGVSWRLSRGQMCLYRLNTHTHTHTLLKDSNNKTTMYTRSHAH